MLGRRFWLLVHRWTGLALAAFLTVSGTTGAILVWQAPLERAFAPALFTLPAGARDAPMLDPFALRDLAERARPEARVLTVDLGRDPDVPAMFPLEPRDPARAPTDDELYLDPHTGRVTGARRSGDLRQGWVNVVPFVDDLHEQLALGEFGATCLGLAALLWTLDCFVGLYLTFPGRDAQPGAAGRMRRVLRWMARWKTAWLVRLGAGAFKVLYDLHRSTGLWLWTMLIVFAWSGVAFNLPEVYQPVMARLGQRPDPRASLPNACASTQPEPDFRAAYAKGQKLLAARLALLGVAVDRERFLGYDPARCFFDYRVHSSRDVARLGNTDLFFAQRDDAPVELWLPTGEGRAATFTTWIEDLHEAQVFGTWFKVLVSVAGLGVALLSVTGVWLFVRKLRGSARTPSR